MSKHIRNIVFHMCQSDLVVLINTQVFDAQTECAIHIITLNMYQLRSQYRRLVRFNVLHRYIIFSMFMLQDNADVTIVSNNF